MIQALKAQVGKPSSLTSQSSSALKEAMCNACIHGSVETIVKLLYDGQVVNNEELKHGWCGLQHACYNGQVQVVQTLLSLGADSTFSRTRDKMDVLMSATSSPLLEDEGVLDCVKLILPTVGDVNNKQVNGYSPLIYAVKRGHLQVVKYLIENGADVDQADLELRTPINWAARQGNIDIVQLLLQNKANASLKNNKNQTSFKTALHAGHSEIAKILAYSQSSSWRPGLPEDHLNVSDMKKGRLASYAKHQQEPGATPDQECPTGCESKCEEKLQKTLTQLELRKFIPLMAKRHMTFNKFLSLTEKDLVDLGLSRLADIVKITQFISNTKIYNSV